MILAGGCGTRYGGPKAFATLPDGRSFLAACRDLLAAAGAAPIVATLPPGEAPPVAADVLALPLPRPELGMFESLQIALVAALQHGEWRRAVVLPVDHPLVRPDTVRALVTVAAAAAVPRRAGKRGHPVMISRGVAEAIATGALPGPALREVLHALAAADVPVDDPGVNANCNTPAALATAWRELNGGA